RKGERGKGGVSEVKEGGGAELLVAGESGAAHLWRLGHGIQQVRMEDSNLYFNSQSSWRWCEFSAHPRVILYADRTGVELTDIRPSSCHTLFRISQAAECYSGERLLLCRYLSTVHSFHHLICTQYSAYIMDERFPCVPMLKCDHMMEAPPVFCQVLSNSGASSEGATKILLGSQRSQEVTLLQYSGGSCVVRAEALKQLSCVLSLAHPLVETLSTETERRVQRLHSKVSFIGLTVWMWVPARAQPQRRCSYLFFLVYLAHVTNSKTLIKKKLFTQIYRSRVFWWKW
uniref:TAF1C beta-propeller domain-containing protein n=1 Tax=Periophthalmus magnuspinnatus TaxID=409849 RepID=A0A3B4BEG9_9GOBI